MRQTDVVVVGGGPAGLATAIAARQRGLQAMVVDAVAPPIDKCCGEGLMPDSLEMLHRLGVSIPAEQSHSFSGIQFHGDGHRVEARFPSGPGLGVRRIALHRLLLEHAEAQGVELAWGRRVSSIGIDHVEIQGERVVCRWVAGADGGSSAVRRWMRLDQARREDLRYGFRRHYRLAPWTDLMELHWGDGMQVYITPVRADQVCVALISRHPHLRFDHAFAQFPELRRRFEGVQLSSPERGGVSASRRLKRVSRGNVALVGDASGSVDAITGEGLCLSFRQALTLAECWERGSLDCYEDRHRALFRRPELMADLMLKMDASAWLRRRALSALERRPAAFRAMLAMHVGAAGWSEMLSGGWQLAAGLVMG